MAGKYDEQEPESCPATTRDERPRTAIPDLCPSDAFERHRLLGNGYCTRPPELDCAFEAICETCTFFQASIEFRPTLQRQRDHAAQHNQTHLFDRLLTRGHEEAS